MSAHPKHISRNRFATRRRCPGRWATLPAVLIVLLLTNAVLLPHTAYMQDGAEPVLRITRLDTSKFPQITVQVYGANLGTELAQADLTLREDGVDQNILGREPIRVGTQTALVLDAAGNIGQPGPTGQPLFLEVGLAARRLVELKLLSPEIDRLTTISFGPDKKISMLRPWSGDHQAVVDSLYIYEPVPEIGNTPLSDLILYAAAQFDDDGLAPDQEKSIVVFSDGVNAVGNTELIDAITDAQNRNIRIHAVLIGAVSPERERNMKRLAAMTNGKYVALSSVEALDDLWRSIAENSEQELLTYRTAKPDPRQIEVEAAMANEQTLTDSRLAPAANLRPIQISILAPAANQLYERQGPAFDTPTGELEPRSMEVNAAFSFPDNLPRAIRSVEYQVGNMPPVVRTEPPFDQPFAIPIDTLAAGDFGLRVRATDELGLVGESNALPIKISEVRPPAPTPTPNATLIAQNAQLQQDAAAAQAQAQAASEEARRTAATAAAAADDLQGRLSEATAMLQRLSWVTIGSGALAVAALGLAIYVLSSKDRRRKATEVITGTVKAVTEPFARSGRKGCSGAQAARAKLVLVDGAGTTNLPPSIPLYGGSMRIGRDPNLVNVVIEDRRISRLHCKITEEGGHYKLLDEGSTSGTYVNEAEVAMGGQVLQSGDVLGIGPINYRFDIDGGPTRPSNGSFENDKMYDHTEPYVRTPGR